MDLHFQIFKASDYAEYAAWFADNELDRQLGPIDQEWLAYTLAQDPTREITWAIFAGPELVGVAEIFFFSGEPKAGFPALAVKPERRRQGFGLAIMRALLARHARAGIREHVANLHQQNTASIRLFRRLGFAPVTGEADAHGYVEYARLKNDG